MNKPVTIKQPRDNAAEGSENYQRIQRLSYLLDECVRLPGGFRIGLDGLIGLIPGVGDIATMAISGYVINEARRYNLPWYITARMIFNVVIETVIGFIPLIGDAFDFYFKANTRNLALLKKHLQGDA